MALENFNVKLMERLVCANQTQTKKMLSHFLNKTYDNIIETKEYIIALGNIPIALVAHLDTVFDFGRKKEPLLLYDKEKNIMFSPDGAGFDDKAGLYAIIQIVRSGLRPHIILTTDEEIGALGAVGVSKQKDLFKDKLNYIIELDRCGSHDCVFYDCENKDFVKHIESFGFKTAIGTFSDISVIAPQLGVAAVNLSIGYYNEHSRAEYLCIGEMNNTIAKVKRILEAKAKHFNYIPKEQGEYVIKCSKCGKYYIIDELNLNTETYELVCNKCYSRGLR